MDLVFAAITRTLKVIDDALFSAIVRTHGKCPDAAAAAVTEGCTKQKMARESAAS